MAERIKLVQGDNLPLVRFTLKHANGLPMDVSGAVVQMFFRAKGSKTVLYTLTPTMPNGGYDGMLVFNFSSNLVNITSGYYEGEIQINYSGSIQTVYDTLQFQIREQFA